jgi:hypothetical protein
MGNQREEKKYVFPIWIPDGNKDQQADNGPEGIGGKGDIQRNKYQGCQD